MAGLTAAPTVIIELLVMGGMYRVLAAEKVGHLTVEHPSMHKRPRHSPDRFGRAA